MTKDAMIKFITSFEHYPTMNSWNGEYGYSINVKVYNLPLREHEKDKLHEIIADVDLSSEFYNRTNDDIENWRYDNMDLFGYHTAKKEISVNVDRMTAKQITERRKSLENTGWAYDRHGTKIMTMWKMVKEVDFDAGFNGRNCGHLVLYKWNGHNYGGRGWTHDIEDLREMSKEDVRYIYKVLKAFEQLSKMLIETARDFSHEEVGEEEYTITKTKKVFKR